MKKIRIFSVKKLALLMGCLALPMSASLANKDNPRVFLWGMAGSEGIGRIDALLPVLSNRTDSLFYTDIQGEVGGDNAWYSGLGLGYRGIARARIYGGYIFVDRNISNYQHDAFYVLNPGFETLGRFGDFRINGYFPVSKRFKQGPSFFLADIQDTCGHNVNCDQSIFQGHQQLSHRFFNFEEVGPGADAEVGFHFAQIPDLSLYGGGYYYRFQKENNITGVEARAVYPLKLGVSLTLETSYDNVQGGAIVGGIRIQLGHNYAPNFVTLSDRLYDPIARNLGAVKSGSGAPIVHGRHDEGLFVRRDNIYFFTSHGGVTFNGAKTGTFEKPLSSDQFTQLTVNSIDALASNANLFFNTGSYLMNPTSLNAPNSRISLPGGQSLFGRTMDFHCSAAGDARPELIGGLDLLEGPNRVDSIILTNALVNPLANVNLIGLNIQNAEVSICNSVINASITTTGDNNFNLFVSGITANKSNVDIHTSQILANSTINGNNNNTGSNLVTGIGGNNVSTNNNNFSINDSQVSALAYIAGDNRNNNFAAGIGGNAISGANADFNNNIFRMNENEISSKANISRNNIAIDMAAGIGGNTAFLSSANFIDNTFFIVGSKITGSCNIITTPFITTNYAFATGIGGSAIGNIFNPATTANFIGNKFTITNSKITGTAVIEKINSVVSSSGRVHVNGIGGKVLNATANFNANFFLINQSIIGGSLQSLDRGGNCTVEGIGGSATRSGSADFNNNSFELEDSQIVVQFTGRELNNFNISLSGIGGNAFTNATASFNDNIFLLNRTQILNSLTSTALNTPSALALATGIGGNANGAIASFKNNTFTLLNSQINTTSIVAENNSILNMVTGIGGNAAFQASIPGNATFVDNNFTINGSQINSNAITDGNNITRNQATGIGRNSAFVSESQFLNNTFTIIASDINDNAIVRGNNSAAGINLATGIGGNAFTNIPNARFNGNQFNIVNNHITSNALVLGNNSNFNAAVGVGGNSNTTVADFLNSNFQISDSTINVLAQVTNANALTGNNRSTGFKADNSTTTDVFSSTGTITAIVGTNFNSNTASLALTSGTGSINFTDSLFNVIVVP